MASSAVARSGKIVRERIFGSIDSRVGEPPPNSFSAHQTDALNGTMSSSHSDHLVYLLVHRCTSVDDAKHFVILLLSV